MGNIMKYQDFIGSVSYSAEDEVLYGKLEFIDDLVNYEGTTVLELKQAFQEAVEDYIVTCKELGKEPQKPFKGVFNVRVKPEIHQKAALLSLEKGISLNQVVSEALTQYVKAS